jgi:hypothetical protein
LLTFVLPVAVAAPASEVGPRMVGWTLAAAVCVTACLVLWPAPWHDILRRRLASAISAVARLADARVPGRSDPDAEAAVTAELARLRTQFSGTPYPPTGTASGAVALSKLVGRIEWVAGNSAMMAAEHWSTERPPARAVTEAVAETLRQTAALVCDGDAHPVDDPERIRAVQDSTRRLHQLIGAALEADVSSVTDAASLPAGVVSGRTEGEPTGEESLAVSLEPGFHARALGIATELVADGALEAAGAEPVVERRLGMGDASVPHVCAPTSPSARCGSATVCAAPSGWPARSPWSR